MMAYQKGRGFNDIFGTLTKTFKPVVEGAANVGASLATGLVTDLLSGKNPKASIKERGNQAKGLVAQLHYKAFRVDVGMFHPVVLAPAIKQQNVNEAVQKVNLQQNVVNKQGVFIPLFIILLGITLTIIL